MAGTLEQRLHEVLDELGHIGAVLPGSISARTTRCQRQGCHCRSDPAVLHGPYETWTWRRRLRQLVAELERLSLELIEDQEHIQLATPTRVGGRLPKGGGQGP
jgi:hypothetical protein